MVASIRRSKPHENCHATKEELREDGLKVMEDCPVCERRRILCEVACHPSTGTSTGLANTGRQSTATSPLPLGIDHSSHTTPSPSKVGTRRNSAKPDSFRKKLIRRNKERTICDICSEDVGIAALEAAHVVDVARRTVLEEAFSALDRVLPSSVNDTSNGLLLCPTCHCHFDRGTIQISGTGKIVLCGDLKKKNYKGLHNTDVPWVGLLGKHMHYPTKELLELALNTKPAPKKRLRELIADSDESEEDAPSTAEAQRAGMVVQDRSQPKSAQKIVRSKKRRRT